MEIAVFVAGVLVVGATIGSAIRTLVLPRGVPARLTRFAFAVTRLLFKLRIGPHPSYAKRDRVMAFYGPVSLLFLLFLWEAVIGSAFSAIFWSLGIRPFGKAFMTSGSSLLTLGTHRAPGLGGAIAMFAEAGLGLLLIALLITFLPSLYAAFSRREAMVSLLEVRAGSPPSALEMILRFHRIHGIEQLREQWPSWEQWFAEVEETHTSFPALVFFRSPQPKESWITAAGSILDAASIRASTLEGPREPSAELCIRAGYLALRRIAEFFRVEFDHDPAPTDPISITRQEYDEVVRQLEEAGVPLKGDRDQAWRDYAGWRVNYDTVLVALAGFLDAPYAPWSSDRAKLNYVAEAAKAKV